MKAKCFKCGSNPESDDKYCGDCGMPTHEVRYGTFQVAEVGDRVIRMTRRGIGFKAALGIVQTIHPNGTVQVKWPHRKNSQPIHANDLCLSFHTNQEGRLIW